ncbi:MAG TPA: CocE/NonD family hydrolase [Blastocatellia bacterium]|nr:CocE/NonD family hydrolase [Blastocatellia bacterium]
MKPQKRTLIRIISVSVWLALAAIASPSYAQEQPYEISEHYTKQEQLIPMRDGVKLFTSIYIPKDASQKYPIMYDRTPYSVAPYGADKFKIVLGPSQHFTKEGYIFVYQDVRGRVMSEGQFEDVRPHNPNKKGATQTDENSDAYDTIEWLLKNIPNHNGRVGIWGISYPGFYTSMSIIDSHPAIKAASPQAPIGDWFMGDDFHHNGTLFLPHAFNFYSGFGLPRPKPTTEFAPPFKHGTPDGYKFFLEMGPLANANKKYFKNEIAFWNEMMKHPNYDDFWKARNILPHLKNIKSAVMTVGGWYDAEDLYGALKTYEHIEKQNPGIVNILVMGPWIHGGWARTDGDQLGQARFGSKTSVFYREKIELAFFNHYLKDKGEMKLPEAYVFLTGSNEWKTYDQWPPKNLKTESLYLHPGGRLAFELPKEGAAESFEEYISDPSKPVPHIDWTSINMTTEYMVADQRHAARRPDVLVYQTDVLTQDVTIAGPITASLFVSTTGTDSDFVVKLIDVFPDDAPDNLPNPGEIRMAGFQMLVRGEPMRARFRNSFERPEPMVPGKVDKVEWVMPDSFHTFKKGHRIMVQVHSSWFPLVDRNPQKFVDINNATEADFQKATQRVYHSRQYGSHVKVGVMK